MRFCDPGGMRQWACTPFRSLRHPIVFPRRSLESLSTKFEIPSPPIHRHESSSEAKYCGLLSLLFEQNSHAFRPSVHLFSQGKERVISTAA